MKKIPNVSLFMLFVFAVNLIAQWETPKLATVNDINNIVTSGSLIYASGNNSDIYKSNNNGETWSKIFTIIVDGLPQKIYSIAANGTDVYAGTSNGIFLSRDNGITWREAISLDRAVTVLQIDDNNIFAGTTQGLYLSENRGVSWKILDNLLSKSIIASISKFGTNYYVVANGGMLELPGGVCVSNDNGKTWKQILKANENMKSIAVDNKIIFCGSELGNVFLSKDDGATWKNINSGVVYSNIKGVAFSKGNLFSAHSKGGVYLSTDGGDTWGMESDALLFNNINSMAINDQYIFVGTNKNGLWKRSLADLLKKLTSIEKISDVIPWEYSLMQNYPNPFNPVTKIKFGLPENAFTKLIIYDILGREVETLINTEMLAGEHDVSFNATNLSSGTYFYKIVANKYTSIKKMLFIK